MARKVDLVRKQHAGFGKEIRSLLKSSKKADRELAGLVVDEIDELKRQREFGIQHPKEDRLAGSLSRISYLRIYLAGYSCRVYFVVEGGVLYMLLLDPNKRQNHISEGTKKKLKVRLSAISSEDRK